ncbi:MAG: hypothetical protein HUJ22_04660 [Gracilimonas sp.]|uniref:hypothetical protein n=1 Tax=Gracilimonas sp. TaxID=1974203 RepID=UPI00198D8240|nr:hypothetical protein [Gracilimonas sp.]MBD3615844.1 hypothetical protein [Gracilimonas sp.]
MHISADSFRARFKEDEAVREDPDVQTAIRGIEEVDEKLQRINKAREDILADRTLNEAAKKAEFVKYVQKADNKISNKISQVSSIVDRRTAELNKVINQEISDEAGSSRYSSEVRSHVASLPHASDRISFVKKLVDSGEYTSVSSILGAPSFLSGLDEKHKKTLLDYYREKRFSKQIRISKAMERIGQSMLDKTTMTTKFRKSIEDKGTLKDLEAQKRRIEAMAN